MKTRYLTLITLIFTTNLMADTITKRLTGSWSNKKEGFGNCTIAFISNGRGYINTGGVGGRFIRWHQVDNTVSITIAAPPKNPTMQGKLVNGTNQLSMTSPVCNSKTFWRISAKEPPDLEEQSKIRHQKSLERQRKNFVSTTTTTDMSINVVDYAYTFASSPAQYMQASIEFTSPQSGKPLHISLTKARTLARIMFTTVEARGETGKDALAKYEYHAAPPKGKFTVQTLVSHRAMQDLEYWIERRNIKLECKYIHLKTIWGIKGYRKFCTLSVNRDPNMFRETMLFLMGKVYPAKHAQFKIIERQPKKSVNRK